MTNIRGSYPAKSVPYPIFFAYDAAGAITIPQGSYVDLTWDTEVIKHTLFSHDDDSATITLGRGNEGRGYYKITVDISIDLVTAGSNSYCRHRLLETISGVEIPGSVSYTLHPGTTTTSDASCSITYIWFVEKEKKLKVQVNKLIGNAVLQTSVNSCRILIEKIT